MSNMDFILHFYSLPRNTSEERRGLLKLLDEDVEYVGIGKETARGIAAIESLFSKYEGSGQSDIKFNIKHIAENGEVVMVDMVDTITIAGKSIDLPLFAVFKVRDNKFTYWQEYYNISLYEEAFGKAIPVTEKAYAS
jgi:limonene-1,2-epoxide hydrolase